MLVPQCKLQQNWPKLPKYSSFSCFKLLYSRHTLIQPISINIFEFISSLMRMSRKLYHQKSKHLKKNKKIPK